MEAALVMAAASETAMVTLMQQGIQIVVVSKIHHVPLYLKVKRPSPPILKEV
jgi:hypothetical protein